MTIPKWQPGAKPLRLTHWDDLASRIGELIHLLEHNRGRYVVIDDASPIRYVQFASLEEGRIDGEAISNYYLKGKERLTPATCRQLLKAGWDSPKGQKTNFWRQWSLPSPTEEMVGMALKTLRDIFKIAMPAEFEIRCGEFPSSPTATTQTLTALAKTGQWIPPAGNPHLRLRPGSIVASATSGRQYRVGETLGAGGFGAVYRAVHVAGGKRLHGPCVLKVTVQVEAWHREAYFGEVLKETPGVVKVHESFAWVPDGKARAPLYCLVSELIEGGDLAHYLKEHPQAWPESKARREIIRLLGSVTLLHASGLVHRDITPRNVLVTSRTELRLADFGIAALRLGKQHPSANVFAPMFAPTAIRAGKTQAWLPADDVYHLGNLFALLLHGGARSKLTSRLVKSLPCSSWAKSVIQRCMGKRSKRFTNASELLRALRKQVAEGSEKRSIVRSLENKRVVFTGRFTIPRKNAVRLLVKAGGIHEHKVSSKTDVVVVGQQSPHWKAEEKGQKLLDLDREQERGHRIAVITERRFQHLVR
jgi:serine/threonine protein kinase